MLDFNNYSSDMLDFNRVLSVSEFNTFLKDVLNGLGYFSIAGEISELSLTQKKGVYITLTDGQANLRLGGYYPAIKGMNLVDKGMKVIVKGYGDIYVPYGSFSVCISSIEPDGEGSLALAYEKLKLVLEDKGFFDPERKKSLPQFITKIALLTAKDSAAFSDFIKILKEHKSGIEVDFYPVIVQGENAVGSILGAMDLIQFKDYDVAVLTRGGGSLEDLKSFNDPEIAEMIFKSRIPFIVGVGHEKDESIADYVADVRASTPSQAAYYLADQNQHFITSLKELSENMYTALEEVIEETQYELNMHIESAYDQIVNQIEMLKSQLEYSSRILSSYDINKTLERGFCLVKKQGKYIKEIKELLTGDDVEIKMRKGERKARIIV